ncbi:uncharacterized protein LOC107884633 [Acyrthosiphon pisum]|uniref:Uncharacterized protein n=1 Tax=Acyrthosiphon pisum TaxID=7029 RepID=A0A8R2D6M5_ACYPI|nr:uncharacterized protein LOC107884633 [Acyrthosiphon pisum]|eukprot:XP_016662647.1 PREDICTED: uncharacterized protein LOC107884633 [Acyrthosiphon pisum]
MQRQHMQQLQKRIRISKDDFGDQPSSEARDRQQCPLRCGRKQVAGRTEQERVLQIERRVPELVSAREMLTTVSKMIAEELTEVIVKLNGIHRKSWQRQISLTSVQIKNTTK